MHTLLHNHNPTITPKKFIFNYNNNMAYYPTQIQIPVSWSQTNVFSYFWMLANLIVRNIVMERFPMIYYELFKYIVKWKNFLIVDLICISLDNNEFLTFKGTYSFGVYESLLFLIFEWFVNSWVYLQHMLQLYFSQFVTCLLSLLITFFVQRLFLLI